MSRTGCGMVAVHNVLVRLGKKSKLSDVIYYFDSREITFGNTGVSIWNLASFLKAKGVKKRFRNINWFNCSIGNYFDIIIGNNI